MNIEYKISVPGIRRHSACLIALVMLACACTEDNKSDELHWFDCKPVLEALDACGVEISLDGETETDPEDAYESCQFARGTTWQKMYKCYKEEETCEEFADCLPDHGFTIPGDDTEDDDSARDEI